MPAAEPTSTVLTQGDVCSYIVRRTQIYLDERQDDRVRARAEALGVTKSEVIRLAIDRYLDAEDDERRLHRFREAVRRSAGSVDLDVEAIERLRQADLDRLDRLIGDAP